MWEYVLLAVCSAILFGLANILQKKGLNQLPTITVRGFFKKFFPTLGSLLKNIYWISGVALGVIAWFLYIEALNTGDLIVVKPIINLNLVVIVILGVLFLKEELKKKEIPLIILIIIGVFLLSFDPRTTGTTTFNEIALMSIILFLGLLVLLINYYSPKTQKKEYLIAISAGVAYGISEIFTKWLSTLNISEIGFPLKIAYFFISPVFWGIVVFTIVGFIIKQSSLSQGRASIAIPIINALSVIIPVIASIIIFGEDLILLFEGVFIFPFSLFRIIGIVVILSSVFVLNYLIIKKRDKIIENQPT
ncbi:MAG: EamA family transporter [Candidatus Odinarchaeia archaeon]